MQERDRLRTALADARSELLPLAAQLAEARADLAPMRAELDALRDELTSMGERIGRVSRSPDTLST